MLFDAEPEGEESLLVCEYYIRERMPVAMQEIEQNAARAALLGTSIIPMLAWMAAALAGIVLAIVNEATCSRRSYSWSCSGSCSYYFRTSSR